MPLAHVERVLRMAAVTPVPDAPSCIAGLIDLHGEPIPVVDLRTRHHKPSKEHALSDRLIVMTVRGQRAALIADEVVDVHEAPLKSREPKDETRSQSGPPHKVFQREEGLVLVPDPCQMLPSELAAWEEKELPQCLLGVGNSSQPFQSCERDDLTAIEGMGEVFARRLNAAGIHSYMALQQAGASEIASLLGMPEARNPEIANWVRQASQLAQLRKAQESSDVR